MLPSYSYLSRSANSDFTNIVTRKFAVPKKLTSIAYCAVKILEIFVICLYFFRSKLNDFIGNYSIFYHLKKLCQNRNPKLDKY